MTELFCSNQGSQLTQVLKSKEEDEIPENLNTIPQISHGIIVSGMELSKIKKSKENQTFKNYQTSKILFKEIELENENKVEKKNEMSSLIINVSQFLNAQIFIKKIKRFSRTYLFRRIKERPFEVIGDKSSNYNFYISEDIFFSSNLSSKWRIFSKNNSFCMYMEKINGALFNFFSQEISTISPRNQLKISWDIFVYLLLAINIFYIPVQLAWADSLSFSSIWRLLMTDIPGWVFLFDISLTFFTAFYEEGILITSKRKIFYHYAKSAFWFDIFVLLPFLINNYMHIPYLNLILLLRLNNLFKRMYQLEELVDLSPNQQLLYDFTKILVSILFLSHFVGCFYYFFAEVETDLGVEGTWIDYYKIPDDFYSQYIISIYWATITMVTIGYGDFTPQTQSERIFSIFISLIGCCFYAVILSSIGSILQQWQLRSQEKRKKVCILTSYLKKRGVSNKLQFKVKKQIAHEYEKDEDYTDEAVQILQSLSTPLQKEIQKDILFRVLKSIKFIQNNYSDKFLEHLISVLKPKECEPGEILIDDNECSERIYCVLNGLIKYELEVQRTQEEDSQFTLETFEKLDSFGEYCFLTGNRNSGRILSLTNSSVIVLERSLFENIIALYPKDYEFYRMQIDQIQIDHTYKYASKRCQVCSEGTHFFFNCPHANLVLYRNKVLFDDSLEKNEKKDQKSIKLIRYIQNKLNTLGMIEYTRAAVVQYLYNNDMEDEIESVEALFGELPKQRNSIIQSPFIKYSEAPSLIDKECNNVEEKSLESQEPRLKKSFIANKKKYSVCSQSGKDFFSELQERLPSVWREGGKQGFQHLMDRRDAACEILQSDDEQQENIEKDNDFMNINNFDIMCNFKIYNPLGNFHEVAIQRKRVQFFKRIKHKKSEESVRKLLFYRNLNHISFLSGSSFESQKSFLSRHSKRKSNNNLDKSVSIHSRSNSKQNLNDSHINDYLSINSSKGSINSAKGSRVGSKVQSRGGSKIQSRLGSKIVNRFDSLTSYHSGSKLLNRQNNKKQRNQSSLLFDPNFALPSIPENKSAIE